VISNEISYQEQQNMLKRLDGHTTTAESDEDVPEGIPIKLKNASTIAENGDDQGKRRGEREREVY
jgi:hypothetical protein